MLFTLLATGACASLLVFERGNLLVPAAWLAAFAFLVFNVGYNLACAVFYLATRPELLPEAELLSIPPCAILYPIRNEAVGLLERIS